jgi:hypothetical protein
MNNYLLSHHCQLQAAKRAIGACGGKTCNRLRLKWIAPVSLLVALLPIVQQEAQSAPEPFITNAITEGDNAFSSLGASLGCLPDDSSEGQSRFAVRAPDNSFGQGRVHFLSPLKIVNTLMSDSPGSGQRLGAELTFIGDINGDSTSDLVVTEPNLSQNSGALHVFVSAKDSASRYLHCSSIKSTQLYASHIFSPAQQNADSARLIVTKEERGLSDIELLSVLYDPSTGSCQFNSDLAGEAFNLEMPVLVAPQSCIDRLDVRRYTPGRILSKSADSAITMKCVEHTPIKVGPNTPGLPAPAANVRQRRVFLKGPRFSSRLEFLGYFWTIRLQQDDNPLAILQDIEEVSVTAKKKLELFTRRERVAIRNLSPGTYTVTYRPVFQSRRSRDQKILGKYSAKQFFTVQ